MLRSDTAAQDSVEADLLPQLLDDDRHVSGVAEWYLADGDSHQVHRAVQTSHKVSVVLIRQALKQECHALNSGSE